MQKEALLKYHTLPGGWIYRTYPPEEVKKVLDWLEKPPATFRMVGETFDTNISTLAKIFGCQIHPWLPKQSSMSKAFLEEIVRQRRQVEKDIIEREEKALLEATKKPGSPPPKKKPAPVVLAKKGKSKIDEEKYSEVEFKFVKVDLMTLILIFAAANEKTTPEVIRFWNCELEPEAITIMAKLLLKERRLILTQNAILMRYFST